MRAILRELGTSAAPGGATPSTPTPRSCSRRSRCSASRRPSPSRRDARTRAPRAPQLAWRPLGLIGAGAALHVLLAETAGFIVAAALLFWLVARAFDARHPLRDAACALGVARPRATRCSTYALGLPLPAGALGAWL